MFLLLPYLLSAPPCARLARTLSPSTPTLTPTHHPPRESGSGVDKRGCFERPPQQTKDIPWPPNSQPHLLHHVPTATKHPPAPIPPGPPAHLLHHLHSSSPPTTPSHHRNCGSNTCRPLRTRRQATSTSNNNNNNHTKTCPPVRKTPLRHPPRQITHLPPAATPWLRPHHPPP